MEKERILIKNLGRSLIMTTNSDMNKGNKHCNFCVNNGLTYKELCPFFISEQINAPIIKEIEKMKARIDKRLQE
jgi:hypothetical protein